MSQLTDRLNRIVLVQYDAASLGREAHAFARKLRRDAGNLPGTARDLERLRRFRRLLAGLVARLDDQVERRATCPAVARNGGGAA